MASPKSIIFLTFLLAALEIGRSSEDYRCKTKEDCNGKVGCIQVVGEELTCAGGTCACVRANSILGPALKVNVLPSPHFSVPGGPSVPDSCKRAKDCGHSFRAGCPDSIARCHHGRCVCN